MVVKTIYEMTLERNTFDYVEQSIMKEKALDMVIAFYRQIIEGDYDEDDDINCNKLRQARMCAMTHLQLIGETDMELHWWISNDENWG